MLDLSLERWRAITGDERRAAAAALARELPTGFRLADVRGELATFARRGRTFALVPGGRGPLGWEPDGWAPAADEQASFADSAAEYGLEPSIVDHVVRATLRRRVVSCAPLLVEVAATELGWQPADDDDGDVRDARARLPAGTGAYTVTVCRGGAEVRVRREAGGAVIAERAPAGTTHAALARELAADGFRFPTADEWERACGGGATTLFRWGDHAPCDRYPTDGGPADAPFDAHVQPNAFGLVIAADPYKYELVAEPDLSRGGDGGSMICGGAGWFLGWLTLATAYFEDHACRRDPAAPIAPGYTIGRRVLPLG